MLANVYAPVAKAVGYQNTDVPPSDVPPLNPSGKTPGPLNPNRRLFAPYPPPNTSAICAGGGPVFVPNLPSECEWYDLTRRTFYEQEALV